MNRNVVVAPAEQPTESYLESLSDLLIGLLFIFIIILMSFSLSLRVATERNHAIERRLSDSIQLRTELLASLRTSLRLERAS